MATRNQYFPQTVSHPGEMLAEKLEELGMGPKEFAVKAGKPEKTITAILKGESSITPEMAVQFENVLQIPARLWLNMQSNYDEYRAREKRLEVIEQAKTWARAFPVNEMLKFGWLPAADTVEEKTSALLKFFGMATPAAWEAYYLRSELKVQFRVSLAHAKNPEALSAWLRRGELQATEMEAPAYADKKFKEVLPEIKALMARHPADFFSRLQHLCLAAGVKVVHTPCLPKAPTSGATRWLQEHPLIQLSGRYKRNDSFWFTFFHEAGHILLHGKKDIFLEQVDYSEKDLEKEAEANDFAQKWTLTEQEEAEILAAAPLTVDSIQAFARKFTTHPALIIGRFHHKKLLHPSIGRDLIQPVELDAQAHYC